MIASLIAPTLNYKLKKIKMLIKHSFLFATFSISKYKYFDNATE